MLDTEFDIEIAEQSDRLTRFILEEATFDPCSTCGADVTEHRHRSPLGFGCALTNCLQFVRTGSK